MTKALLQAVPKTCKDVLMPLLPSAAQATELALSMVSPTTSLPQSTPERGKSGVYGLDLVTRAAAG